MKENETILKKMSAGDVIDYSIEIYKKNFKKVTLLSLIFYVPFSFLYSIAAETLSGDLASINNTAYTSFDLEAAYVISVLALFVLYIIYFATIKSVMDAAIIKVIYDDVVYRKYEGFKQIIKSSFKKTGRIFGYKLLFYLMMAAFGMCALMLVMLLMFFLLMVTGFVSIFTMMAGTSATMMYGVLVLILALIGCFGVGVFLAFFWIRFGFGTHSIVLENKRITQAISRSLRISSKNFWVSFWSLLFGLTIYFVLPLLSVVLISIVSIIDQDLYKSIYFVTTISVQVSQSVFYPFIVTLMTVLFINCKVRNEGLDLEIKVDKLLEEQNKVKQEEFVNAV